MQTPETSGDKSDAYRSFFANVEQFRAIDALPTELYFSDVETTNNFASYLASWHKSCHLRFNNAKLAKGTKRKIPNPVNSGGGKHVGRDSGGRSNSLDVESAFSVRMEQIKGSLHEVSLMLTEISEP